MFLNGFFFGGEFNEKFLDRAYFKENIKAVLLNISTKMAIS